MFIDDFFVISTCAIEGRNLKFQLSGKIKLKDWDQEGKSLGMRIDICNSRLRLYQEQFIDSLSIKFGLELIKIG